MEPVQNGGPDIAKLEEPNDTKIRSGKGDPNIGSVENNSFQKIHLFERGIKVLENICGSEKISEGAKLKSMERKFPTILKVIVGIFTIGIGAAIMHKIEEKYSSEDLSASKGIANELAKLRHAIEQLEQGNTDHVEIKFCDVEISVIKGDGGKLSIKYGQGGFKVIKEYLENNIAENIDLLNKENASEFVENSMLNMAKDIDQFKTKDAGESKQGRKESHEAYKKRKEEYHKIKEEYSKKEKRFKELANKILESSANTNLENLNAKNTSKEVICRVVKRVVTEKAKNEKEVNEKFNEETLIGSNDARKIREKFEEANEEEKASVKIGKTEKKPLEEAKNVPVAGISQVNKVDGNQKQNKTTPQDVHNFVADIILNDDAFIHDKNVLEPGERLKQTFIKHSGTISALLNDKDKKLLDTIDDKIRNAIESSLNEIRGKYIEEYNQARELVNKTKDLFSNVLGYFGGFFGFGNKEVPEEQKNPDPVIIEDYKLKMFFCAIPQNEFLKM